MTDDVERRVRDALRSAALPSAPDALWTSLREIPTEPGTIPRRATRPLSWLLSALLVGVLVAVAALAGILRTGPGPSSIGEPPPDVQVLTAAELRAAIAAQRAGGVGSQYVVVDVAIDAGRKTPPLTRECVPVGTCSIIGTLDGFSDEEGTVTIRHEEYVIPPPTTPADLIPPIALRLSGTAPIEYLGHVALNTGLRKYSVLEVQAATATEADGQVVAVDGWLESTGPNCGLGPDEPPPIPEPFRCVGATKLTGESNGIVPVQLNAYQRFAPDPAVNRTSDKPRHGLYLLRMVVHDAVNCSGCRGWLVVGRLDAAAAPAPSSPAVAITVRSAAELATDLDADRSAWVGRPVFVDGHVVAGSVEGCEPDAACQIGILEGTDERVFASAYTASLLLPDTDHPTNGVMALIVGVEGLEYLGWMAYNTDNTFLFGVDDLLDPQHMARGPETVVVSGWLIDSGLPWLCPIGPDPALLDTPFDVCGGAWLTRDEAQPVRVTSDGTSVSSPPNAIRVQPGAYLEFASDPGLEANGVAHVPRYGTYLVRLVSNPPSAADAERGWQVVARLEP